MSKIAEKAKRYYDSGLWKKSQIDALLEASKITQEEYEYIIKDVSEE